MTGWRKLCELSFPAPPGFIGSHLCDRLLAEGHTVVALDNFLTGSRAESGAPERRTAVPVASSRISREPFAIEGRGCGDEMASPASPKDYLEHPIETLDVGSLGTRACWSWRARRARASC